MYKVYMLINTVNDKRYIGITSQEGSYRLYGTSSSTHQGRANSGNPLPLYSEIREYGIDKFKMVDLTELNFNRNEALKLESEYILKYRSQGYVLYNVDTYQAESATRAMNKIYQDMTPEQRSEYSRCNINSPEAIAKRGETRKGVPQYNIRGKNHGKARSVRVVSHGNSEFDTITQAVEYLKEYYPTINSAAVCKICKGYTPKRYSGLVIEYADCM